MHDQSFTASFMKDLGFTGFLLLRDLAAACPAIPADPGVYVVLREPRSSHGYLARSVGGRFKGQDGTDSVLALREAWVEDTECLYIGMTTTSLRTRVRALAAYGRGEPVGHRGGRYLWQIEEHDQLLVAWRVEQEPTRAEGELLDAFEARYGRLPFANIVRGRRVFAAA